MTLLDEGETTCCYARSEKHWITDPQGIAWEHFQTLGNVPVFSEGSEPCLRRPKPLPSSVAALRRDGVRQAAAAERMTTNVVDPVHAQLGAQRARRGHAESLG